MLENTLKNQGKNAALLFILRSFFSEKENIQCTKNLPMSGNTVKDRILKLVTKKPQHLTEDADTCKSLSICRDESTDGTSSARLSIARFGRGDEVRKALVGNVAQKYHRG